MFGENRKRAYGKQCDDDACSISTKALIAISRFIHLAPGDHILMNSNATWFGHPRGLATMFFAEMWERFSYYGMRAILVLALVDVVAHGGQGLSERDADAIYGLYISGVYVFSLAGGWLSDRVLGPLRSVMLGGITIALGHFTMALPYTMTFYIGMIIIILGTGLFKPTMSNMVGLLYANDPDAKRDAGFSIFYMGINLGSFIGQIVCGYLGEKLGWHYGFAAAGIFMLLGLVQLKLSSKHLDIINTTIVRSNESQSGARNKRTAWLTASIFFGALIVLASLLYTGRIHFNSVLIATYSSYGISALIFGYFIYVLLFGGLVTIEKKHVLSIMIMVLVSAFFWSGFEQAGSSFNLFAQRYTDRTFFGWEMPASWLQSVNSFFIIALAPVFASWWLRLGARSMDPSMPVKFGLGLIQLGLGFLVLFFAAQFVVNGDKVAPTWLIITYLLHSTGELCLSPVGLSTVTKLAPQRYGAQMMGTWFMANALGNVISGLIAGHLGSDNLSEMPYRFLMVFVGTAGVGLLLLLLAKSIAKLTDDHAIN